VLQNQSEPRRSGTGHSSAGDARKDKDGKANAKLKLLAGILDVNLDTLKQREQERRRRLLLQVTGGAVLIAVAMSLVALYAVDQQARAVSARKNAEDILNFLLYQLRDRLQPIGHLDIIEDVQKRVEAYYKNLGFSQQDATALHNWDTLLEQEGDRLLAQGNLGAAKAKYEDRLQIAKKLARQDPGDSDWKRDLSVSYIKLGDVSQAQGDLNGAIAQYQSALEIAQKLAQQDPGNSGWQRDLSVSYDKIGLVLNKQGDVGDARAAFHASLDILTNLINAHGENPTWKADIDWVRKQLGE
jgi:Flp pilus assembly protein TadD